MLEPGAVPGVVQDLISEQDLTPESQSRGAVAVPWLPHGRVDGHIERWLVRDGDPVSLDDKLALFRSGRVAFFLHAPIEGTVRIKQPENVGVGSGEVVAVVDCAWSMRAAV